MKQGATWLFRVFRGLTKPATRWEEVGNYYVVINKDITDITPRNGALITYNW